MTNSMPAWPLRHSVLHPTSRLLNALCVILREADALCVKVLTFPHSFFALRVGRDRHSSRVSRISCTVRGSHPPFLGLHTTELSQDTLKDKNRGRIQPWIRNNFVVFPDRIFGLTCQQVSPRPNRKYFVVAKLIGSCNFKRGDCLHRFSRV